MSLQLPTRRHTRKLGQALAHVLMPGELLILEGDLGAGKTFLVRAVARALGVPTSVPVTSPTFELVHELPGMFPLLHVDLYRLQSSDQLAELGLAHHIGGDAVVLVEWGERFAQELGGERLCIHMQFRTGGGRLASLAAHGPGGHALLARLRAQVAATALFS